MSAVTGLRRAPLLVGAIVLGAACNSITGAADLQIADAPLPPAIGTSGAGGETGTGGSGIGGAGVGAGSVGGAPSATASSSAASSSRAATSSSTSTTGSGGGAFDAVAQSCVDTINGFRATLGLAPYARWYREETCAGQEAQSDAQTMMAHGSYGMCMERAQNECPGWQGPPSSMIGACLQMMWAEGPGPFNQGHGHYDNMSSTQYTMVACGFYVLPDGTVWAEQDFR